MSFIDPKIKSELDMRLAKGDLDMVGYQHLIKTIMQDVEGNSSASTKPAALPFIHPGALRHAWRGVSCSENRLHSRHRSNPDVKNRLLWLDNVLDYFITDKYLIVLSSSSSPDTKVKRIADTIATFGATGALAGGLFISLPALLVGNAYEKLFGEKDQFNPEALATIFNSGYAIYSKKSDLTFQSFNIKPNRFTPVDWSVTVAIVGRFKNAVVGDVDLCFLLGKGADPEIAAVKPLRDAGCLVNENPETLTSEKQAYNYLPPEYADELVWCLNCSHYREQKGWDKGLSFLLANPTGDRTLDSKPSNEKLPCRIPAKASSTWDHFFTLAKGKRTVYPKDCPLFARK
jgi:hypothetical protein